jgi:hypothetical protein
MRQRFGPGYTVGGYCFLPIARTRPSSQGRPPLFPLEHKCQTRVLVKDFTRPVGSRQVLPADGEMGFTWNPYTATRARARCARTREETV